MTAAQSRRVASAIALAIAVLVTALTFRWNTFVAWGTASAAYLDSMRSWAAGEIFTPTTLVHWAPWAAGGETESTFGLRPGAIPGTLVSIYPLGLPVLPRGGVAHRRRRRAPPRRAAPRARARLVRLSARRPHEHALGGR